MRDGLYNAWNSDHWVKKGAGGHCFYKDNRVGGLSAPWSEVDLACMQHFLIPMEYMK